MFYPFSYTALDDDCLRGIIYARSIPPIQWVFDTDFHTSFYQILDKCGMLFCDFVECGDGLIAVLPHTPSGLGSWAPLGDYILQML